MRTETPLIVLGIAMQAVFLAKARAQEVLPFPPTPCASTAGLTMADSIHKRRVQLPIGGGLWSTVLLHPEDAPATPYPEWSFLGAMTRMPETTAPKLGKFANTVSMEIYFEQAPFAWNGTIGAARISHPKK